MASYRVKLAGESLSDALTRIGVSESCVRDWRRRGIQPEITPALIDAMGVLRKHDLPPVYAFRFDVFEDDGAVVLLPREERKPWHVAS